VAEPGTGTIGTLSGLLVVLAFLLLGTEVLLELHARSTVTAVAYETAHRVALSPTASPADRLEAERRGRRLLGPVGSSAAFEWSTDEDDVSLRVRADRPGALLTALGLRPREIDRTVTVRREVPR
jgi:hypothetical protein